MAKRGRGMSPEALLAEIARGDIRSYYLLHGEEEYEREALVSSLISELAPESAREFNMDVVRAERFEVLDFFQLYDSYPIMAECRLIVLRDAEDLSAEQCRSLERLFQRPMETSRLVVVGQKVDMRRKFYRELVRLGRMLEFKPPYEDQVPQWIQRYAKRQKIQINSGAVQLLSQFVGAKPRELVSEIEKLVSLAGEGESITVSTVEEGVGITRGVSVFDLADAIGRGEAERAQELLHRFLGQGEEPALAVAMITRHFRLLLRTRELSNKSLNRNEMASQLGVAPYFLEGYIKQAKRRSTPWLWAAISVLKGADRSLKSLGRHQEHLVLDLLITKLCGVAQRGVKA